VLTNYANQLKTADGRLYLTGLGADVYDQMVRTGKLRETDLVHGYQASPVVGESTERAVAEARAWLVSASDTTPEGAAPDAKSRE
jgi:SulP family sulfate permease